jgi:cytoskeletal protein CcmA (bactofilin family)
MKIRRRIAVLLASAMVMSVMLILVFVPTARAAEFRNGDIVEIGEDEVIDDDLFVSGNRVEIYGTVKGDLIASGVEVIFSGEVEGNLIIAGQTLQANGVVQGSLYGAGYSLTLGPKMQISRNVYFAGFNLATADGSTIDRGLYVGGYQANLNGNIANDVSVGIAALEVNGSVGGDVVGTVGDPDSSFNMPVMPNFPGAVEVERPGLNVSDRAQIEGDVDVTYTEVDVDAPLPTPRSIVPTLINEFIMSRVGELIALLIVGGLLLRFWPAIMQRAQQEAYRRPLNSAGWGCLITLIVFFGVPLAFLVVLFVAIIGGVFTFGQLFNDILGVGSAALTLIATSFLTVFSLVTKAVVGYLGGRMILKQFAPKMVPGFWTDFAGLALGVFIYELLRSIPVLGWFFGIVVILIGLGAIYHALRTQVLGEPEPSEAAA